MDYLFGYDIHEARRRQAAMKALRAVTPCWQRSFFVCELQPAQALELFHALSAGLNRDCDGLVMASACPGRGAGLLAPACNALEGVHLYGASA